MLGAIQTIRNIFFWKIDTQSPTQWATPHKTNTIELWTFVVQIFFLGNLTSSEVTSGMMGRGVKL